MNETIQKAIAELATRLDADTLIIPNHARPTVADMTDLVQALQDAGYELVRVHDWRRDSWSAMIRRIEDE